MVAIAEQRLQVGDLEWFYREGNPLQNLGDRRPVVLLHGLVSQGYSWRGVMPALTAQGFRAIAPDWIGHGFSSRPEPRDFGYSQAAFATALGDFLDALDVGPIHLVVQGYLGMAGLLYGLQNPERIERLVIVNTPLGPTAKLPWKIRQMGLPLAGDMITQDPLLVDRTLEGGGPYRVDDGDLDVYRKPFLTTSAAGRALLATVRRLQLATVTAQLETGLASWQHPTLMVWGVEDPWLPVDLAETWATALPQGELAKLEQVGHYAQEDWAEKVSEVLVPFLRRTVDPRS
ncbi:alpha/beta fold hydrolase [Leptolyngbya sp. PCC 6406]|uniref:alpha/beta fold hydrolase n=1 Tax=Leptolyngbya sp. PCC 6406 TaxID=1173264 RepID=UPI0002AC9048|nr:alpha/beta fold hydrolase [Leptolyngbya sp. PCC 6406]